MKSIINTINSNIVQHNTQKFAVFYTGNDNVYAINIAKVKAFIIVTDITINHAPTTQNEIVGIATIRNEPVTLINLDLWLSNNSEPLSQYKLVIYCEFSNRKIGFLVKDMVNIIEKPTDQVRSSENSNSKITHTMYVDIEDKITLCTIFNMEQLLQDVGLEKNVHMELKKYTNRILDSNKKILVAEDSEVARSILVSFLEKINADYEIYHNGRTLINRIKNISLDSLGLVITDIEIPEVDGYEVVTFIKSNDKYSSIPVIVNSTMTTNAVKKRMYKLGIDAFVAKTDIEKLFIVIQDNLLKGGI